MCFSHLCSKLLFLCIGSHEGAVIVPIMATHVLMHSFCSQHKCMNFIPYTCKHAALTLFRPDTNSADQVQMLSSAASDQCQRCLLFYAKYNKN